MGDQDEFVLALVTIKPSTTFGTIGKIESLFGERWEHVVCVPWRNRARQ